MPSFDANQRADSERQTQGLLRAPIETIQTEVRLMKLWRHECCRVFADKLTTLEDKAAFQKELDHQTALVGRAVLETPEVKHLRCFGDRRSCVCVVAVVSEKLVG